MKKKLMFAFAHPDDETFATGGTIVHYQQQGLEIHLYCATKGEAGKTGHPPYCSKEDLPQVRQQELEKACDIIGVDHLYLRSFKDGQLSHTPELEDDLEDVISAVQPDILVTFPPHGISGHADHIRMQQLCSRLAHEERISGLQSLYYVTRQNDNQDNQPPYGETLDQLDVIINVESTRKVVSEALQAHRTQNISVGRVFPGIFEGKLSGIPAENVYQVAWDAPQYAEKRKAQKRPYHSLFIT
ncbi:PIG-L deacetylase family protein [Caldalkalibacillus salinus]|uniref:PIG-L deacetylase family protein n=1 Tax=Caldalkalibacillus salinus TaxID=2803787 RepID=UPI0019237157|nr:PIG-L deacetylase family protein [Caldalkalibacillus salinus]